MKRFFLLVAMLVVASSAQKCHYRGFYEDDLEGSLPMACRGDSNSTSCCFASIQEAINVPASICPSYDIILDPGVFAHDCASYNISREFHFRARDPYNKPIIQGLFDLDMKVRHVNNMTFTNLIWETSRAIRVRRAEIYHMEFNGCEFQQTYADEVMVKFELVTLRGLLKFSSCRWTSDANTLTSSTSWAAFNFVNQSKLPSGKWSGNLVMDDLEASAARGDEGAFQLMEIDVDGARNFELSNARFSGGATLYLSDSLEVDITNTTFQDTGISSTTSSNITIKGCSFRQIRVLDPAHSPFARSIYFKDASPKGSGLRIVNIVDNLFTDFIPHPPIEIAAVSFSASPARIYFDVVTLTRNRFNGLNQAGLYAVMDEDFKPAIQAAMNWWGSNTGPNDGCNRRGKGANIFWDRPTLRTNVDYRPWCANPSCTDSETNFKNCPWPAWLWAVIALSSGLGLVCVVVALLLVRQYVIDRRYHQLANERDDAYHSRLLKRVSNLDELLAKYNVTRILFSQLEIGERIGEGTFGYVHKAKYTPPTEMFGFVDLDSYGRTKEVAVKYIKNRWLNQYDSLGNFLDEIKIMSMVHHPHVQSLIGLAIDDKENICMVSELMALGSLISVIDSKELDVARKLDLSLDTAYGMAHLHSKGMSVVHRDLKPGNILVSQDWVARVADFGTSIAILARQASSVASAVGTTPVYLSPEAALSNEFSQASDVFAYGITLYELWAQEISYPSLLDGGLSVIQAYAQRRADPDLPRLNSLPSPITELIQRCTSFEPEDRPTFDEIVSHLVSNRSKIRLGVPNTLPKRQKPAKPTTMDYKPIVSSELEMDQLQAHRLPSQDDSPVVLDFN
jgi:serine/threonine protein kinase